MSTPQPCPTPVMFPKEAAAVWNDTNVAAPQEWVGEDDVTSDVSNIEVVSDNVSIKFTGAIVIGNQVKIQPQSAGTTTKELTTHSL